MLTKMIPNTYSTNRDDSDEMREMRGEKEKSCIE
jgi:hypothetical protein